MLGSYGPAPDSKPYIKNFDPEESPSGMVARSGTYHVRSRVVDDDGAVYAGLLFPFFCFLVLTIFFKTGSGISKLRKSGRHLAIPFVVEINNDA